MQLKSIKLKRHLIQHILNVNQKKAKNIEYEEFDDFFEGCRYIISLYKKEIEGQIRKDIDDEISEHNNRRRMLVIDKNIDSGEDFECELLKKKRENIVVF